MVEGFQKRREMPGNMFVEEYALMLTWARLGHDHLRPLWAPHASKRDEAAALHDAISSVRILALGSPPSKTDLSGLSSRRRSSPSHVRRSIASEHRDQWTAFADRTREGTVRAAVETEPLFDDDAGGGADDDPSTLVTSSAPGFVR